MSHDTMRKQNNYQLTKTNAPTLKLRRGKERKQIMKKTLAEAIKGMQVKSWKVREHSNGRRVVYVRFAPKEPTLTVNVKAE